MLAYLLHTVLDWLDERFTHLRELIACRRRLFDDMRALASYFHFPSWSPNRVHDPGPDCRATTPACRPLSTN